MNHCVLNASQFLPAFTTRIPPAETARSAACELQLYFSTPRERGYMLNTTRKFHSTTASSFSDIFRHPASGDIYAPPSDAPTNPTRRWHRRPSTPPAADGRLIRGQEYDASEFPHSMRDRAPAGPERVSSTSNASQPLSPPPLLDGQCTANQDGTLQPRTRTAPQRTPRALGHERHRLPRVVLPGCKKPFFEFERIALERVVHGGVAMAVIRERQIAEQYGLDVTDSRGGAMHALALTHMARESAIGVSRSAVEKSDSTTPHAERAGASPWGATQRAIKRRNPRGCRLSGYARLRHRAPRPLCPCFAQGQSQRWLRERVLCALTKLARPPRELPLGHG
ncbi:hypothetical protein FB451DRAFT_1413650 [Mycena latifolia]|nr:hypothetical protein FB451DRAFT_1413650 [Mycena latifolia]